MSDSLQQTIDGGVAGRADARSSMFLASVRLVSARLAGGEPLGEPWCDVRIGVSVVRGLQCWRAVTGWGRVAATGARHDQHTTGELERMLRPG